MSNLIKLDNVELYWPNLFEVNKLSQKFQVDLANLSTDQIDQIETTGVQIKSKDDERGFFVTCKSKYEITPYDKNGEAISRNVLVGNGSRATIMAKPYSWKSPTGQTGISLGIVKLMVTELNQYVPEETKAEVTVEEDTL
jgi:hypothetical protein